VTILKNSTANLTHHLAQTNHYRQCLAAIVQDPRVAQIGGLGVTAEREVIASCH
jgi:hypothetical protein